MLLYVQKILRKLFWNDRKLIRILTWRTFPHIRRFMYFKKEILTDYDEDINILCDLKYHLDNQLFWQGMQEGDVAIYFYLKDNLDKNTLFIDIGAGIGTFTLIGAKYAKHVFAFEPCPIHYDKLIKNITLNSFKNVTLYKVGLSSRKGFGKLHIPKSNNLGMASLYKEFEKGSDNSSHYEVEIKLDILDSYIDIVHQYTDKNSKILIKMDVEGHEFDVLEGAKEFIYKYNPIIISELNVKFIQKSGKSIDYLFKFADSENYELYILRNENYSYYTLERLLSEKQLNLHQNVILKPKSKLFNLKK